MATSGRGTPPGSGSRSPGGKRPGSGNRRPQPAAGSGPSAADRARDRLAQQQAGGRPRPPKARTQASRRPPQRRGRSSAATAGILGGGLVVIVAVVIIVVSVVSGSGGGKGNDPYIAPFPATAKVLSALSNVPNSKLAAAGNAPSVVSGVGKKGSGAGIVPLSGAPLTKDGKPEIVYLGSEYCPYCAATRWPLVIALSKFGTFHGLQETASSPLDYAGNTHTLDFAHATYKSKYFSFDPTEQYSNHCVSRAVVVDPEGNDPPNTPGYICENDDYYVVQTPPKSTIALVRKYDTKPYFGSQGANGIPFIDFGGRYVESGALYSPTLLWKSNWDAIVTAFKVPNSGIGQAILATANRYIAMLCEVAHNAPAICKQSFVKSAEKALAPSATS